MSTKTLSTTLLATTLFAAAVSFHAHAGHQAGNYHAMPHPAYAHPGHPQQQPAKLGVAISEITLADLDSMGQEFGVRIEQVKPGSIADAAGLQAGDILTAVNGRPAYSPQRLQHLIAGAQGKSQLAVIREDRSLQLQADFSPAAQEPAATKAALGIRIQAMTDDLKAAFGANDERGVLVAQVGQDSAAGKSGIKAGDVVVRVDGKDVSKVADIHAALAERAPGDTVAVDILRDREPTTLNVQLGAAATVAQAPKTGMHPHHMYRHGYGHHGKHGAMPKHGCSMYPKGQRRS